jgi:putative polysaccharide biosynthesis protein
VNRCLRRVRWARETWDAARAVKDQRGLSTFGVLAEQLRLYRQYDLDQYAYYWYRLFERDKPLEEKIHYLPDSVEANARLWSLLTPDHYRCLYDNKLVFNRFFGALGFPVARVYGVYDPEVGSSSEGESLRTVEDLRRWLVRHSSNGFVFKPVEGIQGHRILVFTGPAVEPEQGEAVTLSGERYDARALAEFARETSLLQEHNPGSNPVPFLLEQRLVPHLRLKEFIGPTLCSVRVQTIISREGRPRILAAVFKLQPGTVGVDQLVHGAVGCWVDLDSGRLGRGRTRSGREDTSVIPGTDRPFTGFELPDWPEVKDLALRAAAAFPWARAIGWDIAITDNGPVLIEGNERWSPSLIQMPAPAGLMRGELEELKESLEQTKRTKGKG